MLLLTVWAEFMSAEVTEQASQRSIVSKGRSAPASVISPGVFRTQMMNGPVHFRWKQSSYAYDWRERIMCVVQYWKNLVDKISKLPARNLIESV